MVVSACEPVEGTATMPICDMSNTIISPTISRLLGESDSTVSRLLVAHDNHPNADGDLHRHDSACFGVILSKASTPGFLSHSLTQYETAAAQYGGRPR